MNHLLTNPYHEILRLDENEEMIDILTEFSESNKIQTGWVYALGSTKEIELGFYNLETKEYERKTFTEPLEVLDVTGNIGEKDNEPALHLHGSFSRKDFSTIGGHIHRLIANATVEIFIHKIEGTIKRAHDEKTGLNLITN